MYKDSVSNVISEITTSPVVGEDDPWQPFCFVAVREIPRREEESPFLQIVIKSDYLLKGIKDVMAEVQGVSWDVVPLEVGHYMFHLTHGLRC